MEETRFGICGSCVDLPIDFANSAHEAETLALQGLDQALLATVIAPN